MRTSWRKARFSDCRTEPLDRAVNRYWRVQAKELSDDANSLERETGDHWLFEGTLSYRAKACMVTVRTPACKLNSQQENKIDRGSNGFQLVNDSRPPHPPVASSASGKPRMLRVPRLVNATCRMA
jgi:hypothetical protein